MKKTTVAVLGVVSALAAFGAMTAYAAAPFDKGEKKAYRFISARVENMLDDVEANDVQRQQVNAVKDDVLEQVKGLKSGMEASREELKAQWLANTVDEAKVNALVDQRIDAIRGFAHKAASALIKIHDILTPEQRLKLAKEREARARDFHW